MNIKSTLFAAALLAASAGLCATAHATDTKWQKKHPRREQVNDRLQHQNKRIHNEVKEGDMSNAKAAALHKHDRKIRKEEHHMAHRDHGHITKKDQSTLNHQENQTSKAIGH